MARRRKTQVKDGERVEADLRVCTGEGVEPLRVTAVLEDPDTATVAFAGREPAISVAEEVRKGLLGDDGT